MKATDMEFETVVLMLNETNKNNRFYPTEAIEEALKKHLSSNSQMKGTIEPTMDKVFPVNTTVPTHTVSDLRIEDNKVIGKIRLIDSPHKELLASLIETKADNFRMTCTANVHMKDEVQVLSNITWISCDWWNEPA